MSLDKEIKKLQAQVTNNQMSRRSFMTSAMALGIGAMAPGLYSEAANAAVKPEPAPVTPSSNHGCLPCYTFVSSLARRDMPSRIFSSVICE